MANTRAPHPRGETRVRILAAISDGYVTEGDIAAHIERTAAGIRVHLAAMVGAGIVVRRYERIVTSCMRHGRATDVRRRVARYSVAPVPAHVAEVRQRVLAWLLDHRRSYVRAHVVAAGAGVPQIEAHDALQHLLAHGVVRCIKVDRSLQWRAVADVAMAAK